MMTNTNKCPHHRHYVHEPIEGSAITGYCGRCFVPVTRRVVDTLMGPKFVTEPVVSQGWTDAGTEA